jgi:hypothetical protein
MPDPIDWTKPLETMRGEPAEVVATDLSGSWPYAVKVTWPDGRLVLIRYLPDGTTDLSGLPSPEDLRNVRPAPAEHPGGWVNVYGQRHSWAHPGVAGIYRTRAEADGHARPFRIACLRIPPFREGDGLGDAPEPEPDRSQIGAKPEPGPGDCRNAALKEAARACEDMADAATEDLATYNAYMRCARVIREMMGDRDA